jgi:cytochrome P450
MSPAPVASVDALDLPEIDLFGADFLADPHPLLRDAQARHWLARTQIGYLVLTYDAVHAVLRHPDVKFATVALHGEGELAETMLERSRRNLLHRHGESHTQFRKLVSRAFTPRTVERVRPAMREVLDELFDPACGRGECELVADIAYPYPPQIICALLGVDTARWREVSDWVEILFSSFQLDPTNAPRVWQAQQELDAAMLEVVDRKRHAPGDDLVSDLVAVEVDGERLSDQDIATLADNIITAGTDTTRNELACGVFELATRPDQLELLLGDRSLLPGAVEEILRYRPVVPGTMRETLADVEVDGVRFPTGTVLLPTFLAANRDPTVYPDPDRFDITRKHAQPVLSFGGGPHFCIGAALARAELQEALAHVLDRMPGLELACDRTAVEWKPAVGIGGPVALPLRFEPGH